MAARTEAPALAARDRRLLMAIIVTGALSFSAGAGLLLGYFLRSVAVG